MPACMSAVCGAVLPCGEGRSPALPQTESSSADSAWRKKGKNPWQTLQIAAHIRIGFVYGITIVIIQETIRKCHSIFQNKEEKYRNYYAKLTKIRKRTWEEGSGGKKPMIRFPRCCVAFPALVFQCAIHSCARSRAVLQSRAAAGEQECRAHTAGG